MSKILREEATLRAVIRGMLHEAPYRQSPVVRLGAVQSPGLSVKQILVAGGFLALSKAYAWLSNMCDGKHENFPIIESAKAQDRLVAAKQQPTQTLVTHDGIFKDYKDRLASDQTSPVGPVLLGQGVVKIEARHSDYAQAQGLYNDTQTAGAAWPVTVTNYGNLSDPNKQKVHDLVVKVLHRYTGCDSVSIQAKIGTVAEADKFPFKARTEYIDFMKDVTSNTHQSFQDGVENQRQKIRGKYSDPTSTSTIDTFIQDRKTSEDREYKGAFRLIK